MKHIAASLLLTVSTATAADKLAQLPQPWKETQVQINLPPEKTKTMDLYVVTCAYRGNERRTYGWEPPAVVMEKLSGKK